MSNAEAKNEITQSFRKVTEALKGDLFGTLNRKITKETWPLLEITKEVLESQTVEDRLFAPSTQGNIIWIKK